MADHVAAVQRWQGDEVEYGQHDVNPHRVIKERCEWTADVGSPEVAAEGRARIRGTALPIQSPTAKAVMKLLTGPATAVRMSSRTTRLKFRESTGVGLAQPNGGNPNSISSAGTSMVPKGSMWTMGLSETRPSILAVGSPRRLAIQACADSCTLMANSSTTI